MNNGNCVEDDDCVIFKGSPLYSSLIQGGSIAEEIEFEQLVSAEHQDKEKPAKQTPKQESSDTHRNALLERGKNLASWLCSLFIPDTSEIYKSYNRQLIQHLCSSPCLECDDQDFLQFYLQTEDQKCQSETKRHWLSKLSCASVPCMLSISYYMYNTGSQNAPANLFSWNLVVPLTVLSAVAGFGGLSALQSHRHQSRCRREVKVYQDFLKGMERFTATLKRCLRLIQETELIARGFTLVSQRMPLSRLEGGQKDPITRQCPALRKLVFCVTRQGVELYRDMTKQMLEICPLSAVIDVQSSYLAYEPLQSYGPCLQINLDNIEQLHSITDGFAISALKGMNHLFSLHQSEMIKALSLLQHDRLQQGPGLSDPRLLPLLKSLTLSLDEWSGTLQKSHDYHSCEWMNKEPDLRKPRAQSDAEDIYVAVHSLDLHLQAALTRVRLLSEQLLKENTDQSKVLLQSINEQLEPIRAEIESCKGCWEESLSRIERASGKARLKNTDDTEKDRFKSEILVPDERTAKEVEDYIIEDQVFEGYTDPNEVPFEDDWEMPLTKEEKEKKRREKEEAIRLLSELKSVISIRAVETEKRENAALQKKHLGQNYIDNLTQQNTKLKSMGEDITCESDEVKYTERKPFELLKGEHINQSKDSLTEENIKNEGMCLEDEMKLSSIVKERDESCKVTVENENKISFPCEQLDENFTDEKAKQSVYTSQGIRRLRKSNMLDLSDSDLDAYTEEEEELEPDNMEDSEIQTTEKLGLPMFKIPEKKCLDRGYGETNPKETNINLPVLSLGERLERFSRANLTFTSDIAEKAVARSKLMGVKREVTFGGDVYGECSDDDDADAAAAAAAAAAADNDDDDDDDDNE